MHTHTFTYKHDIFCVFSFVFLVVAVEVVVRPFAYPTYLSSWFSVFVVLNISFFSVLFQLYKQSTIQMKDLHIDYNSPLFNIDKYVSHCLPCVRHTIFIFFISIYIVIIFRVGIYVFSSVLSFFLYWNSDYNDSFHRWCIWRG